MNRVRRWLHEWRARPRTVAAGAGAVLQASRVAGVGAGAVLERVLVRRGPGWLAPDGTWTTARGGGHAKAAWALLDPAGDRPYDPNIGQDYERGLEDRRYVKHLDNVYFCGWYRPAGPWRLSHAQRETIAEWYVERERQLPAWLAEQF